MLLIDDSEIEQRLESLGAHTPQAKIGLVRQILRHVSERMASARDQLAAKLHQAETEPLLELTDELWQEILSGPPRPEDLDQPLGPGVPPEASRLTLREFLARPRS